MALEDWAQRTLARIAPLKDGEAPDPKAIVTITLSAEGAPLESWAAPFAEPLEWLNEAKAVVASYAEEWPKRRVTLLYTASTASGDIVTQCPSSVNGKNTAADAALIGGSGTSAPKAFADAMSAISQVQVATLKQARDMLEWQSSVIKQKDEQIHQFAEYFRIKQEVEATEAKSNADAGSYILGQVKEILPLGLEAVSVFIEDRKQTLAKAATAASAVKAVPAVTPINGVKS